MRNLILVLLLSAAGLTAARGDADDFLRFKNQENESLVGKFTFVRIQYDSYGGADQAWYFFEGRIWQRWETDYPEADENFVYRMAEMTVLDPNPRAIVRRLTDKDLFDYPFIYMCDVGWMVLTREEHDRLGQYLRRGGFLWVDDFWGRAEWDNFERIMQVVIPEAQWREIPKQHPIFKMVFNLEECPQVPARMFAVEGWTTDPPYIHKSPEVEDVHFRGLFDEKGRLLAVATHNTDIGDGWEREAEGEWYFEKYSTLSYAMGFNIIVYALTH